MKKGVAHWFAALEYRDQDGAVLVGERDVATRTIRRTFALAPLAGLAGPGPPRLEPFGQRPRDRALRLRAGRRHGAEHPRPLDRLRHPAPGLSSNAYHAVLGSWVKTLSNTSVNTVSASYSRFRNEIVPVAPGTPQLTFPSIQDGASFRVPQATNQDRFQLSDSLALVRGNAQPEVRGRGAAHRHQLRPGGLPGRPPGDGAGLRGLRPQRRRAGGRRRPAVRGHLAERHPRAQPASSTTATTPTSPSTPRTTGG